MELRNIAATHSDLIVFVVDDDDAVRAPLRRLLESVGLAVEAFASAEEFLARYDARPGCIILDVRMPGMSGLDLQTRLAEQGIQIPIIFISAHADLSTGVRAMKGHAVDFIQKPFNEQMLLDAVHRAMAQASEWKRDQTLRSEIVRRVGLLTRREAEVLAMVVTGMPNKQIASHLGTSEKTIKAHRARVMDKMEAESLPHLVLLAQAAGIGVSQVQLARAVLTAPGGAGQPYASQFVRSSAAG